MDEIDHLNAHHRCGVCSKLIEEDRDFCRRCLAVTFPKPAREAEPVRAAS